MSVNIERVEKKLREARFFPSKMREHERMAFGDKEPFDFYLSAFHKARRTVDYRLRHEQAAMYPTWRTAWDVNLSEAQKSLIKFMVDDRNDEVHESGLNRAVKTEDRGLGAGTHSFEFGTIEISGGIAGVPPSAVIRTPTYNFTIDSRERKATDACGDYLALLERMVAKFKADHS